jgi:hypothetical protein
VDVKDTPGGGLEEVRRTIEKVSIILENAYVTMSRILVEI